MVWQDIMTHLVNLSVECGVYLCVAFHPSQRRLSPCSMLEVDIADMFASDAGTNRSKMRRFLVGRITVRASR